MIELRIEGDRVVGELALAIAPGTRADVQDRAIDAALVDPLTDTAAKLGAVVAAPPHRFVRPIPGKDEAGNTRFAVRARAEGGRLVPDHRPEKERSKKRFP